MYGYYVVETRSTLLALFVNSLKDLCCERDTFLWPRMNLAIPLRIQCDFDWLHKFVSFSLDFMPWGLQGQHHQLELRITVRCPLNLSHNLLWQ